MRLLKLLLCVFLAVQLGLPPAQAMQSPTPPAADSMLVGHASLQAVSSAVPKTGSHFSGLIAPSAPVTSHEASGASVTVAEHNVLPAVILMLKVGLAAYTAYEVAQTIRLAYGMYQELMAGTLSDEELDAALLALGWDVTTGVAADVTLKKLKALEVIYDFLLRSGASRKAAEVLAEINILKKKTRPDGPKRTPYSNALFNTELRPTQLATTELVESVAKRRDLIVAKPGTDDIRFLDMMGADAAAGGPGNLSILVRSNNPQKLTLMEEFLHGTQTRIWGNPDTSAATTAFREWHVRDFMYRHRNMLGFDANDARVLRSELDYWKGKLPSNGYQ